MPVRKWMLQYSVAFPVILLLLSGVQLLKGRDIEYALEFGVIWTIISITVFAVRRAYIFRRNIHCALCNDLPNAREKAEE